MAVDVERLPITTVQRTRCGAGSVQHPADPVVLNEGVVGVPGPDTRRAVAVLAGVVVAGKIAVLDDVVLDYRPLGTEGDNAVTLYPLDRVAPDDEAGRRFRPGPCGRWPIGRRGPIDRDPLPADVADDIVLDVDVGEAPRRPERLADDAAAGLSVVETVCAVDVVDQQIPDGHAVNRHQLRGEVEAPMQVGRV